MITAIVNFRLPAGIDAAKAADLFKGSAPKYRGMKGLVRKYYLFDEQSRIGGGVYLWQSRADADAVYTPQWKTYMAERYGTPPEIRYFETPVVVDNESDKVIADAA
ncbi:MAG: monooxygenase [Alphaproteobacteria bacterium]|nr:monooxygenase [Alphaproteobacteria bacterium]MBV8409988.1 monooxygenase [Alphaproteobacteria bacterium]